MKSNKEKENKMDKLFDTDMRWTRIHEMIKMRIPISVSDRDYYKEEILRKAMEKAMLNGYRKHEVDSFVNYLKENDKKFKSQEQRFKRAVECVPNWSNLEWDKNSQVSLIFSHSFAKAFWKQQGQPTEAGEYEWQLRLQDMALEEDPIEYLKRFI